MLELLLLSKNKRCVVSMVFDLQALNQMYYIYLMGNGKQNQGYNTFIIWG